MKYIILSDLHLGKGKFFKNGEFNILEDFFEDDRFFEFCAYFSSGEYASVPVTLILNGDILNLIQIDYKGVFSHIVNEEIVVDQVQSVYDGHLNFFEGLKNFLKAPNKKIVYVIGNHDVGMAFEKAQERFMELVAGNVIFTQNFKENGIHVEHGHRFEAINTVPPKKYFIKDKSGEKILNLPWGSLFCINVLPKLKKERPYIDKVRPMSSYIKWCLFHDTTFFFKLCFICIRYILKTYTDTYTKINGNFKTSLKILKQVTIYPRYVKMARKILKKNKKVHTVILGHTHIQEYRRFPEGRYYFNTGTWNAIPSIDAGMHQDSKFLTYCMVEVDIETSRFIYGSLNVWKGKWEPFIEEVGTGYINHTN